MLERIKYFGHDDYYHYISYNQLINGWSIPEEIESVSDIVECAEVIRYIEEYTENLAKYKEDCYKLINNNKQILNRSFKELCYELEDEYEYADIVDVLLRYYKEYFTKETLMEIYECTLIRWEKLLNNKKFPQISVAHLTNDDMMKCILENKILSQEIVFNLVSCEVPAFDFTKEQCNIIVKAEIDNGYSEKVLKAIYASNNKQISKLLRVEAKNKINSMVDSMKSNIIASSRCSYQKKDNNYKLTLNTQRGEHEDLVTCNFVSDIKKNNLMLSYNTITKLLLSNDMLFINGIFSIAIKSSASNIMSFFNSTIETEYIHTYTDYYNKKMIEDFKLSSFFNFLSINDIVVYKYINHLIDFQIGNGFFTIKGSEDYYDGNLNNINRHLCIQIDSLIKQYKVFCEYNTVNRELVNLSTESLNFELTSLGKKAKYAIPVKNNKFEPLFYKNRIMMGLSSKSIYDIVSEKSINNQFYMVLSPYTKELINKLICEEILIWNDEGILCFSRLDQVHIMKYLSEMNTLLVRDELLESLTQLQEVNCIKFLNNLFSTEEVNYLNFILKNGSYSDELGLRNEYLHTGESKVTDEEANFELMRIILVIAYKILDEIKNNNVKVVK